MLQQARSPLGTGSTRYSHISVGKNRLSHKDLNGKSTVYMEGGTEFEVELRNNTTDTVAARLKMNGKWIGAGLVLRPGQSYYLDRYLDRPVKFKFEVYQVDNTPEAKEAIRNNGNVEVHWFREVTSVMTTAYTYPSPTLTYRGGTGTPVYDNSTVYYTNSTSVGGMSSVTACCSTGETTPTANQIETGMIGTGGASDQRFGYSDKSFEYTAFQIDKIKILPSSAAPIASVRTYCECGRRHRRGENFCPTCGRRS